MKVAQSRKGFFSGTANHHSAAPTGSRGLQGLSLVRRVGVTDLEVTYWVQANGRKHLSSYVDSEFEYLSIDTSAVHRYKDMLLQWIDISHVQANLPGNLGIHGPQRRIPADFGFLPSFHHNNMHVRSRFNIVK